MEEKKNIKIESHGSLPKNMWRAFLMAYNSDKKSVYIVIVTSLFAALLPIVSSWYFGKILNLLGGTTNKSFFTVAILLVVIYALVETVQPFITNLNSYAAKLLDVNFERYRNNVLAEKRSSLDIQRVEDPNFNNLFQSVNDNSWRIYWYSMGTIDLIRDLVFFVVVFIIMIKIGWWIAASIVISMIPVLYVESIYGENVWDIWNKNSVKKRLSNEYAKYFREASVLSEIKIFQLGKKFVNFLDELWSWFTDSVASVEKKRLLFTSLTLVIAQATLFAIFIILAKNTFEGLMAIGTFTFIFSSMQNLRSTTRSTFKTITEIRNTDLFVNNIFKFLDTPSVIVNGQKMLPPNTPEISFNNVSFAYPETDKIILHDLNLSIPAGTKLAIVGVNGAGKTTFTKLMMRIYDVTSGSVTLDGEDIKNIDINSYYQKLGMLSQEYAKYKVFVSELISFGDPTIPYDKDRAIGAAKQAGAHDFIMEWKNGYETQLGKEFENGVEPSVGQWQKLALARMFYKNPQIWILDEPTASIDALAEMQIFDQLHNLPKDKTVILISHRFNTVKNADKIIVIEDGTIQEEGSHDELMKQNGRYAELFNMQKGSYE